MRSVKFPDLQEARTSGDDFSILVFRGKKSYHECEVPRWLSDLLHRTWAAGRSRGVAEVRDATRKALGL